jgi:hypothetical protein
MSKSDPAQVCRKFDFLWYTDFALNNEAYTRFVTMLQDNFDMSPTGVARSIEELDQHYQEFCSVISSNEDFKDEK